MYTLSAWGPILVVAYVVVFIHQYHKSDPMHIFFGELCGLGLLSNHDDIVVVGAVTPVPGRDVNVIRWRGGSLPDYSYRTRFPIPVRPTSRRHPAFEMMAELGASEHPIELPHADSDASAFVFLPDGKRRSTSGAGTWWISNGEIRMNVNNRVASVLIPFHDANSCTFWRPIFRASTRSSMESSKTNIPLAFIGVQAVDDKPWRTRLRRDIALALHSAHGRALSGDSNR